MNDLENLEEPPPIHRYVSVETRRKAGVFAAWSGRPGESLRTPDSRPAGRTHSSNGVLIIAATLLVLIVQLRILHGLSNVRADVTDVRGKLTETRSSLGVVWQATRRLGEDHTERVNALVDSLRSALAQAQDEVRVWEASRATYGKRLADNDKAMKTMTNGMRTVYTRLEGQRSRLEALERTDRTHSYQIEALNRRAQWQDLSMRDDDPTPSTLRKTLARLDSDLAILEQRLGRSRSTYVLIGRPVANAGKR